MSILKLIIASVLRFFWGKAEDWYREEARFQRNKKELFNESRKIAREMAQRNQDIAAVPESVDDSFLRLEQFSDVAAGSTEQPVGIRWLGSQTKGEGGIEDVDTLDVPEVSTPDEGSDSSDSGEE